MDGSSLVAFATVEMREYRDVTDIFPGFNRLSDHQQLLRLQRLDADYVDRSHNVALDQTLQYLVDELDPNQSPTARTIDQLAVGSDETEPTQSDTSLGSKIGSFSFSSTNDAGKTYETTTILDGSQANGNSIAEVALETSGNTLFNRALVGPRDKNSGNSITLKVTLGFKAVE
jgi:hypothetical protein